jgi:hypothetical protein
VNLPVIDTFTAMLDALEAIASGAALRRTACT